MLRRNGILRDVEVFELEGFCLFRCLLYSSVELGAKEVRVVVVFQLSSQAESKPAFPPLLEAVFQPFRHLLQYFTPFQLFKGVCIAGIGITGICGICIARCFFEKLESGRDFRS